MQKAQALYALMKEDERTGRVRYRLHHGTLQRVGWRGRRALATGLMTAKEELQALISKGFQDVFGLKSNMHQRLQLFF